MPVISIFSDSPNLRQQAGEMIRELARGQPSTLRADCYDTFSDFLTSAERNPRRILMLAQEGPGGVELAADLREHFPRHRFVWFSDLDFALFSYRLEADYFNFLPLTEEKMRKALRNCTPRPAPQTPPQTIPIEKPVVESRLLTTGFLCYNAKSQLRKCRIIESLA